MQKRYEDELEAMRRKLMSADAELEQDRNKFSNADNIINNLKAMLSQKEQQITEMNELSSQQQQRHRVKLEDWQKKRELLENEIREKATQIVMLEGTVASLKAHIERAEEGLLAGQNTVSSYESRLSESEEENRRMRGQLSASQSEINSLNSTREILEEQLSTARREIESMRQLLEERENTLKQTSTKQSKTEDRIRLESLLDILIQYETVITFLKAKVLFNMNLFNFRCIGN